jgi:hypothetical protein
MEPEMGEPLALAQAERAWEKVVELVQEQAAGQELEQELERLRLR